MTKKNQESREDIERSFREMNLDSEYKRAFFSQFQNSGIVQGNPDNAYRLTDVSDTSAPSYLGDKE